MWLLWGCSAILENMRCAAGCVVLLGPAATLALGCGPAVLEPSGTDGASESGDVLDDTDDTDDASSSADASPGERPPSETCVPSSAGCAGCELWRENYGDQNGRDDGFIGLAVAPNGDVVAFGNENRERAFDSNVGDGLVARFSADGTRLWTRSFHDPDAQTHITHGTFDASGELVVIASVANRAASPSTSESRIHRLNDAGESVGAEIVEPLPIGALLRSGTDILLSTYDPEFFSDSYSLHRLDADGPSPPLVTAADLPGNELVVATVSANADGTLTFGGSDHTNGAWMTRWSGGATDWSTNIPEVDDGWVSSTLELPDGSTLYTASQASAETGAEPVVGRVSVDGEPLSSRVHEASGCCANGLGSLTQDDAGRVFALGVVGLDNGGLGTRVVQIETCTGEAMWIWDDIAGAQTNFSGGLGVGSGHVFVSGSVAPNNPDGNAWLVRLDL